MKSKLTFTLALFAFNALAQTPPGTMVPFDKLPDWSGVWTMMGGTVFDRATQTGEGGS